MTSIRARLAAIFGTIALGAFVVVYVAVVPGLESSLVDERLGGLSRSAQQAIGPIERSLTAEDDAATLDRAVNAAADTASARVTLFGVSRGTLGVQTFRRADSAAASRGGAEVDDRLAADAVRSGDTQTGTTSTPEGRAGQVALPLFFLDPDGRRTVGSVALFTTPITDLDGQVSLVRRRVVLAALAALLLAVLAGSITAEQLSRRVRRLEVVAQDVASGHLDARFPVDDPDELGRLAQTLEAMRRQLAELDTARKRFIATASHELRTPLFSLGGFVELLRDEDLDDETRAEFLDQITAQVQRLGKLATDLLDLSKLEAGSLELRLERTDLTSLVEVVAAEFKPALLAHDARLELRRPRERVETLCDPERVAQVLRILIDNALTHTPQGTDVVVTAGRRDEAVRIGVADAGPGITRTMLPHVFEPFVTSDDAQGSGLGLAIAHELAERMHGDLTVESTPGGTTFSLELPA